MAGNKISHLFLRTQRIFYICLTCFEPLWWQLPILMSGLKFVKFRLSGWNLFKKLKFPWKGNACTWVFKQYKRVSNEKSPAPPFWVWPMLLCVPSGVPGPVLPRRGATGQMWRLTVGIVTSTNWYVFSVQNTHQISDLMQKKGICNVSIHLGLIICWSDNTCLYEDK